MSKESEIDKAYRRGRLAGNSEGFVSGLFMGVVLGAGLLALDYFHFGIVLGNSVSYDMFGNRVTVRASRGFTI